MRAFDIYISLIFLVKIIFIFLAVIHVFNKIKKQTNTPKDKNMNTWKILDQYFLILNLNN